MAYLWTFRHGSIASEQQAEVRCDDATRRGVPMPEGWRMALRALSLPLVAERSAAKVSGDAGCGVLSCSVLGVARGPPSAPEVAGAHVGAIKVFEGPGGVQRVYVLCAQVQGCEWLCHPGRAADEDEAFDVSGLAVRDIDAAECRDPSEGAAGTLVALMKGHKAQFAQLLAEAAWKAEELRAQREGRDIDVDAASACFEASPFSWGSLLTRSG